MDQHLNNPPANCLPQGLEENKLLDAVRNSGYPLQSLIASVLSNTFTVFEEWGFPDASTQQHRSLDIYAFRELAQPNNAAKPRLHLLVECKRSDLPYVFFRPGVIRTPTDFPEMLGCGRFSLGLGNNTTSDASAAEFFCARELAFVAHSPDVASAFTRAERKGSAFELSGTVPFNKVILPLVGALKHLRIVFADGGSPMIVLAVCVVDAPMVVASGTPEAPFLCLAPWVR